MPKRLTTFALFAVMVVSIAACASTDASVSINDPYESANRKVHAFNKTLDRAIVRPASEAYDRVTPGLIRLLIENTLSHLELPRDFANNMVSGRWREAGLTFVRFGVNTALGGGGLLDPATDFEIPKQSADFGQTLARYGVAEGIYYEGPIIGPTTVRHTLGRVVDLAMNPASYLAPPIGFVVENSARIIDLRAANASALDNILYETPDSYVTARTFYLRARRGSVEAVNGIVRDPGDDDLEIILE